MKHQEFYRKYKTSYPPILNRWNIVWAILITALVEPFLMLRRSKQTSFSGHYYLQQVEYFILTALPFVLWLFWIYRKESVKRKRGYCWVGKFKVLNKRQSLLRCHLSLSPGENHELTVLRSLFNKIHVGDFIIVRRDALGKLDEVRRVNNVMGRVAKTTVYR